MISILLTIGSILTLSVILGLLNEKLIKSQTTINTMFGALILSIILLLLENSNLVEYKSLVKDFLSHIDFRSLLMDFMLGYLLFAGGLHVNTQYLMKFKTTIFSLALGSTLISTAIVSILTYYSASLFNIDIDFGYCLILERSFHLPIQ